MNYPIYVYNNTDIRLVFPDIGLEIPPNDFFQIINEDVLENVYYTGSSLKLAHTNSQILFTQDTTNPPTESTIIADPYYVSSIDTNDYFVVDTLAERDAIPMSKRKIGILCYVVENGIEYRLLGTLENSGWDIKESVSTLGSYEFDNITDYDYLDTPFSTSSLTWLNILSLNTSSKLTLGNYELFITCTYALSSRWVPLYLRVVKNGIQLTGQYYSATTPRGGHFQTYTSMIMVPINNPGVDVFTLQAKVDTGTSVQFTYAMIKAGRIS
jgi:hypothetical protein